MVRNGTPSSSQDYNHGREGVLKLIILKLINLKLIILKVINLTIALLWL